MMTIVSALRIAAACLFVSISLAGELLYEAGARSAGLGNATVIHSDIWSAFNNQAGLAGVAKVTVAAGHAIRFGLPETGVTHLAAAFPYRSITLALSLAQYGFRLYREQKVGLACGKKLGRRICAGVQLNYHRVSIGGGYGSAGTLVAEGGLRADLSDEVVIAVHMRNPSLARLPAHTGEPIPLVVRFGGAYMPSGSVTLPVEMETTFMHRPALKGGVEFMAEGLEGKSGGLVLRLGFSSAPAAITFGCRINAGGLPLEIAGALYLSTGFGSALSAAYEAN